MADTLRPALAAWSRQQDDGTLARVHAALVDAVVLLPVRAVALAEAAAPATGLRAEREAELSLLTVSLPDGRRVLPVFTDTDDLRRWQLEARPVQASLRSACREVLDQGWAGLVIDVATSGFVVSGAVVAALAEGALPVLGPSAAAGDLVAVLRRAVAREPAVAAAWLVATDPPTVALRLKVALDDEGLVTVTDRLRRRLDASGTAGLTVTTVGAETDADAEASGTRLWP